MATCIPFEDNVITLFRDFCYQLEALGSEYIIYPPANSWSGRKEHLKNGTFYINTYIKLC